MPIQNNCEQLLLSCIKAAFLLGTASLIKNTSLRAFKNKPRSRSISSWLCCETNRKWFANCCELHDAPF